LNFGDTDKKINTFIVLKNVLEKGGKTEEVRLHSDFIEKIKRKDENLDNDLANLKKVWNALKFNDREQFSGTIKSILPNGKAGFVETDKGKSYYFSLREFKGNPKKAVLGAKVTFYLEEGFDAKKDRKTMTAVKIEYRA
jgi:YHS domain-containing protein